MPLFIDRMPFDQWTDQTRTPPLTYYSPVLSVYVTEPGLAAPPANISPQHWVVDTGNTGEAFAWRLHLIQAGLDPDKSRLSSHIRVAGSVIQAPQRAMLRSAALWLVSNVAQFQGRPFRLQLDRGLPFLDVPNRPDPHFQRPLIGMRAMRRAGLRVELDFAADVISVWTP
jgi:hypothetical protein